LIRQKNRNRCVLPDSKYTKNAFAFFEGRGSAGHPIDWCREKEVPRFRGSRYLNTTNTAVPPYGRYY